MSPSVKPAFSAIVSVGFMWMPRATSSPARLCGSAWIFPAGDLREHRVGRAVVCAAEDSFASVPRYASDTSRARGCSTPISGGRLASTNLRCAFAITKNGFFPRRDWISRAMAAASSSVFSSRPAKNPAPPVFIPSPLRSGTPGIAVVPPCGAEMMIGRSPFCTEMKSAAPNCFSSAANVARTFSAGRRIAAADWRRNVRRGTEWRAGEGLTREPHSRHARRGETNFQRRYAGNAAGSVSESAVTSSAITSVGSTMGTGSNPAAFSAR